MGLASQQIILIRNYFENQPVLKAWLFGSMARNEEQDSSDIDILLALDYSKPVGLEFIQMRIDLEQLLKSKVDLVSERGLSPFIKDAVIKDRRLIYDRQTG
jgi:predicted nucleotidyltransferase